jgi:hypothetical protein
MAIISPVIFGDAVNERLRTNLLADRVAFNATSLAPEILVAGHSVNLPLLNRVAQAGLVTKGTPLVPSNIAMTDRPTLIKQAGTSVRVFDVEATQIKGDVLDSMVAQVSTAMAKFIDSDLFAAARSGATLITPLASPTSVSFDELMTALTVFGDQRELSDFAGIVVSGTMLNSLIKMDEFVSVNVTFQNAQGATTNGLVVDSVAGYFLGIPVYVSNQTIDTVQGDTIFILKNWALAYILQTSVKVEIEREAKLLADDIVASVLFGTKLLDPAGLSLLKYTTP